MLPNVRTGVVRRLCNKVRKNYSGAGLLHGRHIPNECTPRTKINFCLTGCVMQLVCGGNRRHACHKVRSRHIEASGSRPQWLSPTDDSPHPPRGPGRPRRRAPVHGHDERAAQSRHYPLPRKHRALGRTDRRQGHRRAWSRAAHRDRNDRVRERPERRLSAHQRHRGMGPFRRLVIALGRAQPLVFQTLEACLCVPQAVPPHPRA